MSVTKADLFLFINNRHTLFFDEFFKLVTWIGDGTVMISFGVIMLFVKYRYSLLTFMAYAYTSVFAQLLKRIFHSPRPAKFFDGIHEIYKVKGYKIHDWNSFPSGHSVSAFSLGVVLTCFLTYKSRHLFILPIAILTAFSRVYLAQHFFEDVVAGSVLGVILTFQLMWWLENTKWYQSPKLDGKLFNRTLKRELVVNS
ncbi:MAG: phosphatase PAP2 family protein [Daejeonella sp.]